jgi:hypothetical protein
MFSKNKKGIVCRMGLFLKLVFAIILCVGGLWIVAAAPNSPLPGDWNPYANLEPLAKPNALTPYKLARVGNDPKKCTALLASARAKFYELPDMVTSDKCGIETQTRITRLTSATIKDLDTRCDMALRLLMWEAHSVQPAAQDIFGQPATRLTHFGSYSCRPMRTSNGSSGRMSEHAQANAIDIQGFAVGSRIITLKAGWDGAPKDQEFLRRVGKGACQFFRSVLTPDYNKLHADHFHFDQGRWISCR